MQLWRGHSIWTRLCLPSCIVRLTAPKAGTCCSRSPQTPSQLILLGMPHSVMVAYLAYQLELSGSTAPKPGTRPAESSVFTYASHTLSWSPATTSGARRVTAQACLRGVDRLQGSAARMSGRILQANLQSDQKPAHVHIKHCSNYLTCPLPVAPSVPTSRYASKMSSSISTTVSIILLWYSCACSFMSSGISTVWKVAPISCTTGVQQVGPVTYQ